MTITQETSAPLVVVCGATGVQGGSVIKALTESDRAYRIRGLTRDPTKPSARGLTTLGVEMVGVSLVLGNESEVLKAFEGANIVFAMTNFWEHMDKQRETDEGIMLVKTAKAVGVDLFIWSGLESVIELSGGKYTLVHPFESKAAVTKYGRNSGVPFVNVQAGYYASNLTGFAKPSKQADGSYVLTVPCSPSTVLPVIDMVQDYGIFVREAIESPAFGAGSEILTCGELISIRDCMSQLAEITGEKISCVQIGDEEYIAAFPFPRSVGMEILESFHFQEEFGYYGGKDVNPSQQHLIRKPRTWAEYARGIDWATILG